MKKEVKKRRGRPRKNNSWTAELLRKRANEYFRNCDNETKTVLTKQGDLVEIDNPRPYTIEGLCVALGIARETFRQWQNRDGELKEAAQEIHLRIAENHIVSAARGDTNSAMAQFILKVYEPAEYTEKKQEENSSSPLVSIFSVCQGTKIEIKND